MGVGADLVSARRPICVVSFTKRVIPSSSKRIHHIVMVVSPRADTVIGPYNARCFFHAKAQSVSSSAVVSCSKRMLGCGMLFTN